MSAADGGPAFPTPGWQRTWFERGDEYSESCDAIAGMTLRDYFAAQAMAAIISTPGNHHERITAEAAYSVADAMLLQREAIP